MKARSLKLLAIDDNPDHLTALEAVLKDALPGCVLLTAPDGLRGVELARTEDPDLILLDIALPGAQIAAIAKLKAASGLRRREEQELAAPVAERTRELERQLAVSQQAERTLRESEALIRAVLDNLPVGIAVNSVDPVVSFIYMNDSFTRLYRTTRERLAHPDAFWETVYEDPEFREAIRQRVLEDCASGDAERMHWEDVPVARRGEETTFISARNIPVPGKPLVMSAVWDVTGRWRTEEALRSANRALRQSADEYRELFEAESDAIFLIDNESGRLLQANQAACALYGYSREELLSMRNVDLSAEPEDTREVTQHTPPVASRVVNIPLRRHRRKDGTILPVEITGRFFARDGRSVHIAAIRDITERKRAEEEREALDAQLRQAQKMESVGRLAGGVAHDFNNALGVVLGRAELALKRIEPGNPVGHHLGAIREAALRSANLTRQLLAFARRQTIAPKVLDLNEAVAGTLDMLRHLIGESVRLSWTPGAGLWPVKMDPAQVDQVLANLLVNARDAIDGVGEVRVATRNVILDEAFCAVRGGCVPGEYVALSVADDGCGMEKDVLDRVFEPFFTTKGVGQGTGLGLATVYGIVKQNVGYIDAASMPGEGTTFDVYLPSMAGHVPEEAPAAGAAVELRGLGETVLLVEDEPAMLDVEAEMLADLGYSVLKAGRPGQALSLAGAHSGSIHLLVTDMVMPEMNGRDLAERLTAIRPGIRCLFVSGYTADVIASRGVLDDGVRLLEKPFSRRDLAVKLREALEQ